MAETVKSRDSYFDNAKFLLIALVVFGHFISPHKEDSTILYTIYNFIYTFHMPAFILIAGYFSKNFHKKGYLKKIFQKVLVPYFIFQSIYAVFYSLQAKEISYSLFDPYWTLWFLLSLVSWNLLLVLFTRFKYSLIVALSIGVFIGYIQDIGTYLSLLRTFVFFPVFLLGYYLKREHFEIILQKKWRITAGVTLFVMIFSYHFLFPNSAKDWLLSSSSYSELGVEGGQAALIRIIIYSLMFLATFCFLAIVPRRETFFTKLGSRSLYVYLLHGFTVKLFSLTHFYDYIDETSSFIILLPLAIMITFLLSSDLVTKWARPIIELPSYLRKTWLTTKT